VSGFNLLPGFGQAIYLPVLSFKGQQILLRWGEGEEKERKRERERERERERLHLIYDGPSLSDLTAG
jgi:hypothetical protein